MEWGGIANEPKQKPLPQQHSEDLATRADKFPFIEYIVTLHQDIEPHCHTDGDTKRLNVIF